MRPESRRMRELFRHIIAGPARLIAWWCDWILRDLPENEPGISAEEREQRVNDRQW